MLNSVVKVEGLSKIYRAYARPVDRLIEALLRRPRHHAFVALEDVSFSIAPGEGLGIIGENGAGKSTLLKILAGVTAATAGSVEVKGPLASILELGSAFHPEFTGRQNIALNAAMLGLSREEILEKTPAILDFSELGNYIDQPVKTYSTGMAMRLAFAIATQVQPEVLIVDEALSVGDGYFQKKCMDHINRFVDRGGTILFCSHAMYYVSSFCRRALWLKDGKIQALGPVQEVVSGYERYLIERGAPEAPRQTEASDSPARLDEIQLLSGPVHETGSPLQLELAWTSNDPDAAFHIGIGINRPDEVIVAACLSRDSGHPPWTGHSSYRTRFVIPALPLAKGNFKIYVFLLAEDCLHVYDTKIISDAFSIRELEYDCGLIRLEHHWEDGNSV